MSEMTIELPNSPGVEVTITRGGLDPITKESLSDRWVHVSWEVADEDSVTKTRTETHSFIGPST